jgi:type I restriction enzyme S subunit
MSTATTHIETEKRSAERSRSKLAPALRFKEFEGEWRETTLGNLFTFKNGLNSDKEKYGSGTKFINVLDIIEEDVITYDSIIGKVEVTEKELEKNEVIYGDVLFQRSSETREEVGQANIYVDENKSAVFGGFVIRGRKKEDYNPYFMNYLLKTSPARKEITTKSGGSTRYNVGQASLSEVFVNLTSLPEQQKIASFLSAVDEKIQQLTKKKALLEQYKKGVMQQLFSGQLRFKDENGKDYPDWEDTFFSDTGKILIGLTHTPIYQATGRPFLSSKNISGAFIDFENIQHISEEKFQSMPESTKPKKGDILFTRVGSNLGNPKILEEDIEFGIFVSLGIFRVNEKASNYFMRLWMDSNYFWRQLEQKVAGGAKNNLNTGWLKEFKLNLPSLPEQKKIATYLSGIDTKIESVNNQITQTQTFKKGLLQQMFV